MKGALPSENLHSGRLSHRTQSPAARAEAVRAGRHTGRSTPTKWPAGRTLTGSSTWAWAGQGVLTGPDEAALRALLLWTKAEPQKAFTREPLLII